MDRNAPIGVFDSGIGGVSVLGQCLSLMPHENYIFFGDDANCPYGEKTDDEIKALTVSAMEYLKKRGVKAAVIACNTATATAAGEVRKLFDFPIVGIEPAVKPALAETEGRVLVLATPATVRQPKFVSLVNELDTGQKADMLPCEGLAAIIESELGHFRKSRAYLTEKLSSIEKEKYGAVVLGCTHYAFVRDIIASLMPGCRIFNGDIGEAKRLHSILERDDMLSDGEGSVEFVFSAQNGMKRKKLKYLEKYLEMFK